MKDSSFGEFVGGTVNHHYFSLEEMPSQLQPAKQHGFTDRWPRDLFSNMPSQPETSASLLLDDFVAPIYVSSYNNAQVATNPSFHSQYLYPPTWCDWAGSVNGEYMLTANDVFPPSMPIPPAFGGAHLPGYTNHPWLPLYTNPINLDRQVNATTTPSFVFGVPAPFPAEGTWGYQLAPCIAPISSQAVYRPMAMQATEPWPLMMPSPCDPGAWWDPPQDTSRRTGLPPGPPVLSSPSTSSLASHEMSPHTSSTSFDPSLAFGMAPPAGRTAVMIRRREGSHLKPADRGETQYGLCLWDDCREEIPCDRSSVNQHMHRHIQDLCAGGLLYCNDGSPFRGQPKSKHLRKCQTHCRWRGEIPCPYSDQYESKTHETMLRKQRQRMQKLFGRGVKRSDWGRNVHVRHPDTQSEESGSEIEIKSVHSRARPNGSMISVQSLVKHICGTHLLSLMMTCEDCDERFSRTDAYGRHRREVHEGEPRGRAH